MSQDARAGRLAPTPSGAIHLGNASSFLAAWLSARSAGAEILLRVEDVDRSRARRHVEDQQKRDLEWLGLGWDREVLPQRDREYAPWLAALPGVYRCECSRRTIARGGGLHPLACRDRNSASGAWRWTLPDESVRFVDRVHGVRDVRPMDFGDPVVRRRDEVYTYNLAVVADDILDGVTEIVRGADLLDFSALQILLWRAFGATPPTFLHAPVIVGPDGRKLSKSHGAPSIRELANAGASPEQVRALLLVWLGQSPNAYDDPSRFDVTRIPTETFEVQPEKFQLSNSVK